MTLSGIWTPTLVPLNDRGQVNEPELRRFIDWLIEAGVQGLFPNGSTGEFIRFTSEERRWIAAITCDQAMGRVPVIVGCAEASIKETLNASEAYRAMGARAAAVIAPFYYPLSSSSIYEYFRQLGEASTIDVMLYNMPRFANPIDIETVQRLSSLQRIVGIKDSSGDLTFMMRMIQSISPLRHDFAFLTGWDSQVVAMLLAGATGGVNATSNVAPQLIRKLYDLTLKGNLEEAHRLQHVVTRLFDLMFQGHNFPDGFRAGVETRGFNFGSGRQPTGLPMPDPKVLAMKAEIAKILDDEAKYESRITRHDP
jgi:4-hydroxy-tetrahydrodipicolinate synthase